MMRHVTSARCHAAFTIGPAPATIGRVRLKRLAIVVHRWLGVAACLLFAIWFPSGIVMMYWDFPSVTPADRLERAAPLEPSQITLSPNDALLRSGVSFSPSTARLNTFDGRPVYRFRAGSTERIVYADTGEERSRASRELMARVASRWARQPSMMATLANVDLDQWTVQGSFRTLRPLWKFSWPDGQQVYVSELSGEVVQYTTTGSRLGAWVGAIPHWLYFTPLRRHELAWNRVVIWTSALATIAAALGLVVGVWMFAPSKPYRRGGAPTAIPYRGQKRWHMVLGLLFGVGAVTWAFSGLLSMEPFPEPGAARRAGDGFPRMLRDPLDVAAFSPRDPRDVLRTLGRPVKELEFTSVGGEPLYLAMLDSGETRVVPLGVPPRLDVAPAVLTRAIARASASVGLASQTTLDRYDRYYRDRLKRQPLPVTLVILNDATGSRYYVDPKTARVVGAYTGDWLSRWLYHGLHSFDFPWLYDHRPLWDIVMLTFMLGGTALCVTSLVMAWRVIGRQLADDDLSSSRQPAV
jgi:hypothetical protein